jgi:hypothetical protein
MVLSELRLPYPILSSAPLAMASCLRSRPEVLERQSHLRTHLLATIQTRTEVQ